MFLHYTTTPLENFALPWKNVFGRGLSVEFVITNSNEQISISFPNFHLKSLTNNIARAMFVMRKVKCTSSFREIEDKNSNF